MILVVGKSCLYFIFILPLSKSDFIFISRKTSSRKKLSLTLIQEHKAAELFPELQASL